MSHLAQSPNLLNLSLAGSPLAHSLLADSPLAPRVIVWENAIIVKVNGDNFRILSEIFHQNMFEYSLLQHTYRLKWTALQNRHTVHKQLVNWHLQGDTWFS